ncbi:CAZyme family CE4 [Agaricus bisporus var. burnettii]|uniref:CAZyme family CE4 n=1 Tax=Agaricus bisporus var. burnettii TaxID=192524 RepID=A0A8H7F149_AGABI|nr:CAZyme family CE4 [Agaricus bisporus var. burnettii]
MLFTKISVVLATLAASVFAAPHKRQLAQVITTCTEPNTVALTFDDGPYYYIYDISRALVAANATGTFFFNGNNYGCIYNADNAKRIKYAHDHGHQVASHTWGHKDLATLTWDEIHDEMWRVEEALLKITGAYPAFTRPPFGSYNDLVRQAAAVRGQALANWDFETGDAVGVTVPEQYAKIDELIARHPNTILSLQHETIASTMTEVLPYFLQQLQGAGYRLVSVAECTGLPAYQYVTEPQQADETWHC